MHWNILGWAYVSQWWRKYTEGEGQRQKLSTPNSLYGPCKHNSSEKLRYSIHWAVQTREAETAIELVWLTHIETGPRIRSRKRIQRNCSTPKPNSTRQMIPQMQEYPYPTTCGLLDSKIILSQQIIKGLKTTSKLSGLYSLWQNLWERAKLQTHEPPSSSIHPSVIMPQPGRGSWDTSSTSFWLQKGNTRTEYIHKPPLSIYRSGASRPGWSGDKKKKPPTSLGNMNIFSGQGNTTSQRSWKPSSAGKRK